jgi:hypothetical protein
MKSEQALIALMKRYKPVYLAICNDNVKTAAVLSVLDAQSTPEVDVPTTGLVQMSLQRLAGATLQTYSPKELAHALSLLVDAQFITMPEILALRTVQYPETVWTIQVHYAVIVRAFLQTVHAPLVYLESRYPKADQLTCLTLILQTFFPAFDITTLTPGFVTTLLYLSTGG